MAIHVQVAIIALMGRLPTHHVLPGDTTVRMPRAATMHAPRLTTVLICRRRIPYVPWVTTVPTCPRPTSFALRAITVHMPRAVTMHVQG